MSAPDTAVIHEGERRSVPVSQVVPGDIILIAEGVRESGELEQLRSRFERLRTIANTHAAEIEEWSQRVGRPLRLPRIAFPWPPAAIWDALLAEAVEAPKLVWDDDPQAPSA